MYILTNTIILRKSKFAENFVIFSYLRASSIATEQSL